MGQRLSLDGLHALRKPRELGFPCPCGPSLALGQTAFCGAPSRSSWPLLRERPAPERGCPGNRFARVPRGRGPCPPSGGPALGRLNPEGIRPVTAPPEGHIQPGGLDAAAAAGPAQPFGCSTVPGGTCAASVALLIILRATFFFFFACIAITGTRLPIHLQGPHIPCGPSLTRTIASCMTRNHSNPAKTLTTTLATTPT